MTWSIYLGSVYDNPEGIKAIGLFVNGDVTLCEGCVFDYLTIQWNNVSLSQNDLDLWLPSSLPVPLTSKFFLGIYLENPVSYSELLLIVPKMVKLNH